ncbi:MAG: DUF4465 domain-containing protein [Bacteroidia bacterium]|jgi:hypothetical protein|nr:DUF4465 domain-containing protein [Bacteroidia bacterium]
MKRQLLIVLMAAFSFGAFAQIDHQRVYSTFDNLPLSKSDTFNNGADSSGGFNHYGRFFNNTYFSWGGWSGWALSNMKDTITTGSTNQYSAITGYGVSRTPNYMVSTGNGAYIKLDEATEISGAYFTNATYTARDMEQGSGFSKKFGGDDGNDEDFLYIIISSYLSGEFVDSTIFYLADYRFADNSQDYIVKDWTFVDFNNDMSTGVIIDSISFRYEGSDTGSFGLNTPKYVCMDDFNAISDSRVGGYEFQLDEDTFYNGSDDAGGFVLDQMFFSNKYDFKWGTWSGWSLSNQYDSITEGPTNQYSSMARPGIAFPESDLTIHQQNFISNGVSNEIRGPYLDGEKSSISGLVLLPAPITLSITNTTYAYRDMESGSGSSKKFGGTSGDDPDYFRLLVHSITIDSDTINTDTIYLADFRFEDNSEDYILREWKEARIEACHKLGFQLESSDNGSFGMNTPAYFSMSLTQNFVASVTEENKLVQVLAYPNPTSSLLNLQAEDVIENIRILSLDGRTLANENTKVLSKKVLVNTGELALGVYFAVVTTAKGTVTKRFIKQ